jgi:hypothetical protein
LDPRQAATAGRTVRSRRSTAFRRRRNGCAGPERPVGCEIACARQHADLPAAESLDDLVELRSRHRAEPARHLPPRAELLIDRFGPAKIEHRKHQPLVGDVLEQEREEPVGRIIGQNAAPARMHLFQRQNHRRGVGPVAAIGQLHHRNDALTCPREFAFRVTKLRWNHPVVRNPAIAQDSAHLEAVG